jgi:hypothetical protein
MNDTGQLLFWPLRHMLPGSHSWLSNPLQGEKGGVCEEHCARL